MHLGLIGKSLVHSFSKKYFEAKFQRDKIEDHQYELFELEEIDEIVDLVDRHRLDGFNVTIPYKEKILPFLHTVSEAAGEIGAVNCVKILEGQWIGHNTDYLGLIQSIRPYLNSGVKRALIIGSGGASKAVVYGLKSLNISCEILSRDVKNGCITYEKLESDGLQSFQLIIQTTPLGTFPHIEEYPMIPYDQITNHHICMDLIYNPSVTMFMKKCALKGATILNGEKMLEIQAEESWKIWNEL